MRREYLIAVLLYLLLPITQLFAEEFDIIDNDTVDVNTPVWGAWVNSGGATEV